MGRAGSRIIIDAFNLFHRWGPTRDAFLADGDIGRTVTRALARFLPLLRRLPGAHTLVLDGGVRAVSERRGGATVRYAGPGRKADAVILDMVRESPRPHDVRVVTTDRALGGGARALGAQPQTVEDFLDELSALPDPEPGNPLKDARPSEEEVRRYLSIFGDGSDIGGDGSDR